MGPRLRITVAAAAVAGLVAGIAAPAGAQEELGFEIDRDEGSPGEVVNGQVDTDGVAEHCITDVESFQETMLERVESILELVFGEPEVSDPESFEELATVLIALITLGILFDAELAEDVLAQTFIMTFADIATQEPVGEMGNFDPTTGEGSVVVPDIEPGFWAVAAACVSPSTDPDEILAAIAEAGAFVETVDLSPFGFSEPFPTVDELIEALLIVEDEEFLALLQEIGPSLLQSLMVPDALGAQIFCILDAEGECPDDELPPEEPEEPRPAEPVVVEPVFTG